ncbi:MAG: methyltransferase domain-containing protein [Acidimicrobiales bacterium]|nr:methyltransferase domain-containing protein [Acidimicrobiales bacterium]
MAHLLSSDEFTRRKGRLLAQARGRVLELDTSLQGGDGRYDTVVTAYTLCGVTDIDRAIRRIDELLAPGGQVLVLEHVRATGVRGIVQDGASVWWRRVPGGCHANRDPIAAFRRNGFAVVDCDRFRDRRSLPIVAPHISAVAVRKAQPPVKEEEVTE